MHCLNEEASIKSSRLYLHLVSPFPVSLAEQLLVMVQYRHLLLFHFFLLSLNQCLAAVFWTEAVGQWSLWIGQLDYLRSTSLHVSHHILILPGVILFIMLDELVLDMFTQIMHENMTIFAQLPTAWCVHYHQDLRYCTKFVVITDADEVDWPKVSW